VKHGSLIANIVGYVVYSWGRPKSVSEGGKKFANLFFNRFAKPCMAAYMKLLLQNKQHNNVPPRIIQLAYVYLGHTYVIALISSLRLWAELLTRVVLVLIVSH
jgi:hypothetical protein